MNFWEVYFEAVRKQNWQKAIEFLSELKGSEPENPQVFLKLGDAYQKLGRPEKAVHEYSQAAWLFLKDGFVQKALAVYKIILRLDPHNQEAINKSRELMIEIELAKQKQEVGQTEQQSKREAEQQEIIEKIIPQTSTVTSQSYDPDLVPEFLKNLPFEEIRDIMTGLKAHQFKKGEIIIEEGDSGDSVFIIKSGKVLVTTHVLGKRIELATLQKGDLFGEVAFLTGRPRTATITAMEDMEVLELTRPLLEGLIEKRPDILKMLQDFYYSRLQNTIKKATTQTHKRA